MNTNLSQELLNETVEFGMEDHQPDVPSTDGTEKPNQEIPDFDPERGCDDTTTVPINTGQLEHMKLNKHKEIPQKRTRQKIDIFEVWMEFVYSERIKNGLYDRLPRLGKDRCECKKSQIGYPHWPPTSFEEAKAQFEYRLREKNTHKKYLTHCWWVFCNNMAEQHPWNVGGKQQIYRKQAEEVERRCPTLQEELIQEEPYRRPEGWRCFEYCEPTLKKGSCSCLCFCEHHMGRCPVHSW